VNFDVAADAYDRFMGAWSSGLSAQLATFAGITRGVRVLDVGCGPGNLTAELVGRLGPQAVAAVDPSESFVAAARARHPGVDVRQAPAEALPFLDSAFDAALAQLVVHFMTDPLVGLEEMARVVRPGGIVAACVWDFEGNRGPLGPFWEAAVALDPTVVGESHLAGARQGHLVELLDEVGMHQVSEATLTVSRVFDGFDPWWETFTRGVGPAGSYVAGLDADRLEALRDLCRSMLPGGSFTLSAVAWAARGVVL
jgi:SAM-dependent methyltransferase